MDTCTLRLPAPGRRPRRLLAAALALCLSAVLGCASPTGLAALRDAHPEARWVLFVGNSHTYANDLPGMLERLARLAGDDALRTHAVAKPDYALEDHWYEGDVQRILERYPWAFVVMQQGPSSLPANQDHLRIWSQQFAPLARAAGAEPVLYQIWPCVGRRELDAANALLAYTNAAAAVDGLLAPAGDAFTAALASPLALGVYSGDGMHASTRGTYVAALTILARLNDLDPRTLPPVIPGHDAPEEIVRALQDAAATALARNPARP